MSRANDLASSESRMLSLLGLNNATITANKVLAAHEIGVLLIDATAGAVTVTLPAANVPMDVLVRRVDNTGNRLVVAAAGADKIKFHTHLNASGYGFLVLMGAGDFWQLRSDGNGGWVPLSRYDSTPVGRPLVDTSTTFSPGGYGALAGAVLNRADWPWLWDHAQQSGMLTTEAARTGMEGGYTSGDGALTFRVPDLRGEFLRFLDESRGVDPSRIAGSWQTDLLRAHGHNIDSPSNPTGFGTGKIARGNRSDSNGLPNTEIYGGTETRGRNIAYPGRLKMI